VLNEAKKVTKRKGKSKAATAKISFVLLNAM